MKKQYTVPEIISRESRITFKLMQTSGEDGVSPHNKIGNRTQLTNEREDCDDDTPFSTLWNFEDK